MLLESGVVSRLGALAKERQPLLRASVTPLASIFGSGLLIIVPILERTVGPWAAVAIAGVCLLAWFVGNAVRYVVAHVEPMLESGELDGTSRSVERWSDGVIVAAYVISVALYVRIMAEYVVAYVGGSEAAGRILACATVALIVGVGVVRGFAGLDKLDRLALGAVIVLVTAVGTCFAIADASDLLGGGIELPPVPGIGIGEVLLILGGILITVQGFETVRFLGDEFDRETRIRASRFAQLLAASVYVGFAAVATPLMGTATGHGPDSDLIDIVNRLFPPLALPLVIGAVLSQFSAATADTAAAAGNLHEIAPGPTAGSRAYAISGGVAIVLAATVPTFTIVAVASRAFAAYYCLQCVLVVRVCEGRARKLGYGLLALVLLAITLLAEPAA